MLDDSEILKIVLAEEDDAISYLSDLSEKREELIDRYNCEPFGNEQEGQSSVVTSDVANVVEGMLPTLLTIFTQGKNVAQFDYDREDQAEEAMQKTALANYVFLRQNNGVMILHNMFKDALLQYTGTVKIYWEEGTEVKRYKFEGMSKEDIIRLSMDESVEIEEIEQEENGLAEVKCKSTKKTGKVCIDNIPPEEFVIARRARSFENPPFIGHRSPKTRSQLIEMGFDADIVNSLPTGDSNKNDGIKQARLHDLGYSVDNNASNHRPNDEIYLGEYYVRIDVDGDGIAELWQVHVAGNQVLGKEMVDDHPFAVVVPIPIPHRAIGTCPAEQAASIQFRKSTLVRQMNDNIYYTNTPRIAVNERVELDDLLNIRPGSPIRINDGGSVGDAMMPVVIPSLVADMLPVIEYVNTELEVSTGVTRYNQGMDTDSLNKTATGFRGIKDMSMQRIELIARVMATGVKDIFSKIIATTAKYQSEQLQIMAAGKALNINPKAWGDNLDCRIDVGIGSGDRIEKISNLNFILQTQMQMMQAGMVLSDQAKMYKTLERLITESGLKDATYYFNNPEIPQETLFAQNQQLVAMVQELQAAQKNPLAEAESIKAEASLIRLRGEMELKLAEARNNAESEMQRFYLEQAAKMEQFNRDMAARLTELELKYSHNVPGALT